MDDYGSGSAGLRQHVLAATRARIEGRENRLVATVFLASGLLFVTCLLAAAPSPDRSS